MEFAELVTAESQTLNAAVYAIVGDWQRAEDITQDAFERCYARWRRVSKLDRPGAWVRRVAINAAISAQRRNVNEKRALARIEANGAAVSSDLAQPLADQQIWDAVRALPKEQAAAVALHYVADLSIDDIAETMHLSVPAVKSLLYRARGTLRTSNAIANQVSSHD